MQKPPVDFSDPIYDLYWKNLSNQNESYSKCLSHYLRTFWSMRAALTAAHASTCQTLRDLNCPMPEYMNSSYTVDQTIMMKSEVRKKKTPRKVSRTKSPAESDVDEEYLKFYQEGLKYRQDYEKRTKEKDLKETSESIKQPSFTMDWMGQDRQAELRKLYGENKWQKILWLETELQLKHDRSIDQFQPKHWPSFPLRIKFD